MDNSFFEQLIREFRTPLTNPVLIFSLILLIILLSPIILKKINIPGIIGLIISGVVIGPHGFNILAKNSAVDLFSTIGLLYIMFIAGLELDLKEFQKHKNKSLVFGVFTFMLPLSLGFPVCYYLLKYEINSSFLTASMFATHTLVAYPIVSRFGISKNKAVAITVGGTILTDTAVLLILAIVLGSANGSLNHEFWLRLGTSLAIFSVIMFAGVPRMAKWFFSKLESEKTSHYIFVMSVVFFSAFLAQVAGVEPIIGAFVAGLALNKLIPHSSALMNRIEFIGNAIFIPFFLISVGMLVNIRVLLNGPTALIVAGALTITAIFGKWLAAVLMQKVFRYTKTERQLIFGLSSAHAAATLAIILVGYEQGILDENILNGTIILILITCLTASFVTENAAKKMVMETEMEILPEDTATDNLKEHILLPIEDFKKIEHILELAIFIKDKKSLNPITLLTIVPNDDEAEKNLLIARKKMEDIRHLASATDTNINVIASIDYNAVSGIIRSAKEIMADTILLEWPERSNIFDRVFGEKTENIIAGADKNVFLCQIKHLLAAHKRILVFCPPLMELEKGFGLCLHNLLRLSKELTTPVICYTNQRTKREIEIYLSRNEKGSILFKEFDQWEDFLVLSKDITEEDLLITMLTKRGAVSYQPLFDSLPVKLDKYFGNTSKILVFPRQQSADSRFDDYEDINAEPLSKGIETIQKIGKEIGNIFRK